MKNGGQIPWNAFPICETFKISCQSYLDCSLDTLCRIWKGDVLVADIEKLETMDASETYSKKKTQCKRK